MTRRWAAYLLLVASCMLAVGYGAAVIGAGQFGVDFGGTLWEPARSLIHGGTPYPNHQNLHGSPSVYPPPVILAFTPLSLLPFGIAAVTICVLLLAAATATLYVLGLRDWFVYAVVLSSLAVVGASTWGNDAPLMVLFVALAWRDRTRSWVWAAFAILLKLWMFPLLLWLAFTRRRQAVLAALTILAAVTVAWTLIGGDGLAGYADRLRSLQDAQGPNGILLYALLLKLSGSATVATFGAMASAAILCLIARTLDERRMFQLILVACLVASPIMWSSYLALLMVTIAVSNRRSERAMWFVMPALWVVAVSPPGSPRPLWLVGYVMCLVAVVMTFALDVPLRRRIAARPFHPIGMQGRPHVAASLSVPRKRTSEL
jgi:Glycosyltransferase family 87